MTSVIPHFVNEAASVFGDVIEGKLISDTIDALSTWVYGVRGRLALCHFGLTANGNSGLRRQQTPLTAALISDFLLDTSTSWCSSTVTTFSVLGASGALLRSASVRLRSNLGGSKKKKKKNTTQLHESTKRLKVGGVKIKRMQPY